MAPAAKKTATKVQKTIKKKDSKPQNNNQKNKAIKNFDVDEDMRYSGTCVHYNTAAGYGFVKPDSDSGIPIESVMVYWKNIESDDRWPFLHKGLKVQFSLQKTKKGKEEQLKCVKVTDENGDNVSLQEDNEEKFDYVGDRSMRFLGNVKFFDFSKGFGYVTLQKGYEIDAKVPTELRVARQQINAGTDAPNLTKGMEVEFGIQISKKGAYQCYRMTLPGGDDIIREVVDNRQPLNNTVLKGTITFWNRDGGFGWIKPTSTLDKASQAALQEDLTKRQAKAKKAGKEEPKEAAIYFRRGDRANFDTRIGRSTDVTFKLYKDDQGVGACEVTCL
jgi:cold shock CspA family protein